MQAVLTTECNAQLAGKYQRQAGVWQLCGVCTGDETGFCRSGAGGDEGSTTGLCEVDGLSWINLAS